VRATLGGVDILVNNAGILGGLSVLEMPLERWNRQIGVNLTGTFLCTKHVARSMVEQGRRGSIIVIVSTAGHQGQAGNIALTSKRL
jgi:NAD(P)-dependent dehydrogenase (short-subunit alcohol dehydrogenase family)